MPIKAYSNAIRKLRYYKIINYLKITLKKKNCFKKKILLIYLVKLNLFTFRPRTKF